MLQVHHTAHPKRSDGRYSFYYKKRDKEDTATRAWLRARQEELWGIWYDYLTSNLPDKCITTGGIGHWKR
jgi:hypothetical protein